MHRFQVFSPPEELRDIVKNYFVTRVTEEGDLPTSTIVYPMNIPSLNFLSKQGIYQFTNPEGNRVQASAITMIGQISCSRKIEFIQPGSIISVIFTPCGLNRLLRVNMNDIRDKAINPGENIGVNHLEECRQQIFNANSLKASLGRLNRFLNKWARKPEAVPGVIDKMAALINKKKGNVNIDWLVCEANMSIKTFERHFEEKIGVMPKLFSRITRFAHAVKLLQSKVDIFSIIRDCGYTDHAHLIKEFRSFCDKTPKFFLNQNEETRFFFNHLLSD